MSLEIGVLKHLHNKSHFPKYIGDGVFENYKYVVMQLLGNWCSLYLHDTINVKLQVIAQLDRITIVLLRSQFVRTP